jgi:hypothetical protein
VAVPIPGPESGSWLWQPAPGDATAAGGWPAGDYRIDVLLTGRVVHVLGRIVGDAAPRPRPTPGATSAIPLLQAVSGFEPGPFALTPTSVVPVAADPGGPLADIEAWLGPAREPGPDRRVGRIVGDPIEGIGLLLAPGERLVSIELAELVPEPALLVLRRIDLAGITGYGRDVGPAVTLLPAAGTAIGDGLYALTATFHDADGILRTTTWNLEILPADPPLRAALPLVQLKYLVVARSEVDGLGRGPIVGPEDVAGSDGDGTCGGTARIGPTDEMIALAAGPDDDVRDLRLVPIDTIRRIDVDVRFALDVADGLTLIALPHGGIAARHYALLATLGGGSTRTERQYTVCVG